MKVQQELLTLEQVKAGIDRLLLEENWNSLRYEENPEEFSKQFNELFGRHLKHIPYLVKRVNSKDVDLKFFRVRKVDEKFNAELISTHASPPSEVCTKLQRANIPHFPVFYGSENPGTAITEIMQGKSGNMRDVYVLSEWSFKANTIINICPLIFGSSQVPWVQDFVSGAIKYIKNDILNGYQEAQKDGFIEVLKFLSNLFIFENARPITSHIAHMNMYAQHGYRPDLIIYPSIQTKMNTVNFAIHPNAVAEKAKLENVYSLKIGKLDHLVSFCRCTGCILYFLLKLFLVENINELSDGFNFLGPDVCVDELLNLPFVFFVINFIAVALDYCKSQL